MQLLLFTLVLVAAATYKPGVIDLRVDLHKLTPLALAQHLAHLQHYLSGQQRVPGADSGKVRLMLQLIELHRAAAPSRREPLHRLGQQVRSHAREMRSLVRALLRQADADAETGGPSPMPASLAEQALYQAEHGDWELHSYATRAELRRFRGALAEFRAHDEWGAEKRRALDAVLHQLRGLEAARRLMRLFEARAPDGTLSRAQLEAALGRIALLTERDDVVKAASLYRTLRTAPALLKFHALWVSERVRDK